MEKDRFANIHMFIRRICDCMKSYWCFVVHELLCPNICKSEMMEAMEHTNTGQDRVFYIIPMRERKRERERERKSERACIHAARNAIDEAESNSHSIEFSL